MKSNFFLTLIFVASITGIDSLYANSTDDSELTSTYKTLKGSSWTWNLSIVRASGNSSGQDVTKTKGKIKLSRLKHDELTVQWEEQSKNLAVSKKELFLIYEKVLNNNWFLLVGGKTEVTSSKDFQHGLLGFMGNPSSNLNLKIYGMIDSQNPGAFVEIASTFSLVDTLGVKLAYEIEHISPTTDIKIKLKGIYSLDPNMDFYVELQDKMKLSDFEGFKKSFEVTLGVGLKL